MTKTPVSPESPAPEPGAHEYDHAASSKNLYDLDGHPARLEVWSWDGIYGMSLLFETEDVAALSDEQLFALALDAGVASEGSYTVKRKPDTTFLNFSFSYDDD